MKKETGEIEVRILDYMKCSGICEKCTAGKDFQINGQFFNMCNILSMYKGKLLEEVKELFRNC